MYRTHTCGELSEKNLNQKVIVTGWVNKRRDFGKIIFIDLRDRYGLIQLVIDTEKLTKDEIKQIRNEWVIQAEGFVKKRSEGMENKNLKSGTIEISIEKIEILSEAKTPPFSIFEDTTVTNEELRLKYRFLDIRRKEIYEKIILRSKVAFQIRKALIENDFIEVTTPVLCKSTPEGARDYLVPSRLFAGNFYALPQSPQIFKQLLMIGGLDRYFQLPICFRDEDPRADRQPEFTQVDIEMSFAEKEDLFKILEKMVKDIFKNIINIDVNIPILRMSYSEAMEKYGTDKPDLRYKMELTRLEDILKKSKFQIFTDVLKNNSIIKAINAKNCSSYSRKELDEFVSIVKPFGIPNLFFIKKMDSEYTSSILKFLDDDIIKELEKRLHIENGDLIIIACAREDIVNKSLDHIRRKIAKDKKLCSDDDYKFLWVVDFPLFELDKETNAITSCHHPFTSPIADDLHLLEKDPLKVKAEAYDLVLNGYEIAGGSKRIFRSDIQKMIFSLLKLTDKEIDDKFGFFIEALKYGTPPHLGIAFGLDRLIMLLAKTENIRDVIAFPKTLKGLDLMLNSPSFVNENQLKDLSINSTKKEEIKWQ